MPLTAAAPLTQGRMSRATITSASVVVSGTKGLASRAAADGGSRADAALACVER
jgi:hypothetical protein